ncbi:MAG: helix-turn-helix transcriptional regulator [Oscillospiraceae bacterium]|nr:helix-turn-helix transcriptional regulator [Oscillospiraceae bacterium]
MSNLYNRIEELCKENNESITTMCKEAGVSRASLSDLKMGRNQSLSAETLSKIAAHFGVSVDYLLGEENKKAPTNAGERKVSDDDIKFALFGGDGEITDEMFDEVKRFAEMVKLREDTKKKKEQ